MPTTTEASGCMLSVFIFPNMPLLKALQALKSGHITHLSGLVHPLVLVLDQTSSRLRMKTSPLLQVDLSLSYVIDGTYIASTENTM